MNLLEIHREWLFDAADEPIDRLVGQVSALVHKNGELPRDQNPEDLDEDLHLEQRDFAEDLLGAAFVICQVYVSNIIGQVHSTSMSVELKTDTPLALGGTAIVEVLKARRLFHRQRQERIEVGGESRLVVNDLSSKDNDAIRKKIASAQLECRKSLLKAFPGAFGPVPAALGLDASANYWKHRDEWGSESWSHAPTARPTTVDAIKGMGLDETSTPINMTLAAKYFGVPTDSDDLAPLAHAARDWAWAVADTVDTELLTRKLVSPDWKWMSKRIA